jgi:uncharacterized protein YacL
VTGTRTLIIVISAATGVCFTILAGLSIRAAVAPVRRFHISSVAIAIVAACLAYLAFRAAARAADADEEALVASLRPGTIGAVVGLIIIFLLLLMFGDHTRSLLAHALSQPTSSFTTPLLLIASVLLGFGTGFVLGMATFRRTKVD